MSKRSALLLASVLSLAGCAGGIGLLRHAVLPPQARVDPSRYVVVTVRNDFSAPALSPGSTPRGYGAVSQYGVSARARATVHALERDYRLREVSAWPIQALKVHCIVFRLSPSVRRSSMIARLERDSRIESVQPLNQFRTAGSGSARRAPDPGSPPTIRSYIRLQRNLRHLGVFKAQRLSKGAGVRIAIIDTGIDYRHPQLQGRVIERRNFVQGGTSDFARDRHGTEVAGVIAAVSTGGGILGIAPAARLLALKACWPIRRNAPQARCDTFTLALALDAAIAAHANVVNLSLAGPADPLLSRLIRYGMRRGIVYVGAVAPARLGLRHAFPADIPGVLPVQSAEDPHHAPRTLLAPGRGILTLVPGGHYDFASGSSMATAEMTGIVALLLAKDGRLSAAELDTILAGTTRRLTTRDGPMTSVDACAALAQALRMPDCRPGGALAQGVPALRR